MSAFAVVFYALLNGLTAGIIILSKAIDTIEIRNVATDKLAVYCDVIRTQSGSALFTAVIAAHFVFTTFVRRIMQS